MTMYYSAYIYFEDIRICRISYFDNGIDSYEYIFEPFYHILDSLNDANFRGIQGIDLSLRKDKYIRKNLQPVFIFERNPIRKKKNFRGLQRINGTTLLEFIANSNMSYFGDKLNIKP